MKLEKIVQYFNGKSLSVRALTRSGKIYINGYIAGCYTKVGNEYFSHLFCPGNSVEDPFYTDCVRGSLEHITKTAMDNISIYYTGLDTLKHNQASIKRSVVNFLARY